MAAPPPRQDSRPREIAEAAIKDSAPTSSLSILDPRDEIARHIGGTFVVVVETPAGKYRRRCFLSVKAAEQAAQRAIERGENVKVYLAELKPLWRVVAPTRRGAA
jgi:hypothetical protein